MIYINRKDAAATLSHLLKHYHHHKNTIILGLARGGMVIASEIAKNLELPCNVLTPRKLGAPDNEELAIGAVSEDGELFLNTYIIQELDVSSSYIENEKKRQMKLSKERASLYRKDNPLPSIHHKTIILVDDGVATGATLFASIQSLKNQNVEKIIVAVPVAPFDTWEKVKQMVDEAICPLSPENFYGVSQFYEDFPPVSDDEVLTLLKNTKSP